MKLRTLKNADIKNKTVLYRSPYDIGTKHTEGSYVIKDDSRIRATIPTLKYLLKQNCKIVIITFVGRPKGKAVAKLSTKPHAIALSKVLSHNVKHIDNCIGKKVGTAVSKMSPKDIIMLENTRFYKQETKNDDNFAKKLTEGKDFIVFDGFPQAHREHASTTGILRHLPSCAGFYLENEVKNLSGLIDHPVHPFTLLIGGIKFETKLDVMNRFLDKVDHILIGGRLPADPVAVKLAHNPKVINGTLTNDEYDIEPETVSVFSEIIRVSKTVLWAGPMGRFEDGVHDKGTSSIARAVTRVKKNGGTSIVAGGDTIEALKKYGTPSKINHISLAGGATLEFLAGRKLPALEMLIGVTPICGDHRKTLSGQRKRG